MKNQPIYGDKAKSVNNLEGSVITYSASVKGSITKIVTKREILALVSLLLGTNIKVCGHIIGDMDKSWIIQKGAVLAYLATIKGLITGIVTKTASWALVSLQLDTSIKPYGTILGDMTSIHIWHNLQRFGKVRYQKKVISLVVKFPWNK